MKNIFLELAVFSVGGLADETRVREVLAAVMAAGLVPTTCGYSEPLRQKFDPTNLDGLARLWEGQGERCMFKFGKKGLMTIGTKTSTMPGFQSVRIQIDYKAVHSSLVEMKNLLRALCSICKAEYGCASLSGGSPFSVNVQDPEANFGEVAGIRIPPVSPSAIKFLNGVWWLNFFGSNYTSFFGKRVLSSLTSVSFEGQGDSACFLQVSDLPEEAWTDEGLILIKEIKERLNKPTAFYGYAPSKPGFMQQYSTPDFQQTNAQK